MQLEILGNMLEVEKEGDCWHVVGRTSGNYPCIYYRGETYKICRVLMLGLARPTRAVQVCHTCDNVNCVNPDHLYIGTAKSNMRDRKGVGYTGPKTKECERKERKKLARRLRSEGRTFREVGETLNCTPQAARYLVKS